MEDEMSIELSYDEIRQVILETGFQIEVSVTSDSLLLKALVHLEHSRCGNGSQFKMVGSHPFFFHHFLFVQKEQRKECCYDDNSRSMLRSLYNCVFFTARKPQP